MDHCGLSWRHSHPGVYPGSGQISEPTGGERTRRARAWRARARAWPWLRRGHRRTARWCPPRAQEPHDTVGGRLELSARAKIEPAQAAFAERDDQILVDAVPCVVVLLRVRVDGARAVGSLGHELRRRRYVGVVRRSRTPAR